MKPFRFGVSVASASSRADWLAKARRVQELGYSTLLTPDHLADVLPPLGALVAAAQATDELRVGTLVLNNDLRHPVLLAREAAALDLLTDGRLELGIGAGHMRSEYEETGLTFDPSSVRIERLAEAVTIIKNLLTGQKVSFEGRHYVLKEHQIYPLPVQKPHPPMLIGGNGSKLLSVAARAADIVGLTGLTHRRGGARMDLSAFTATAAADRVAFIREVAAERFDGLELNALVQSVVVTDDRQSAAQKIAERLTGLAPEEVLETPYLLVGTIEQIVDSLQARRERLGISYYVVFEPALEAFAAVVTRLAGA
jgi:probable F420-dependent oxidoreductase